MKRPHTPPRAALTILFTVVVFVILAITMFIIGSVLFMLSQAGVLKRIDSHNIAFPIMVLALVSTFVGTAVAAIIGRFPLKPVNILINGMNRLAGGDYSVRINPGNVSVLQEVSDSFNALAGELQNTEMLRSDFINNFSHEFKTPIVSIRGFANLIRKGNIAEQQQREYLDIIVNESTRLAEMATSILNLTKIENQTILTDVTCFNLSEQIRGCILLLDKKWMQKHLTIDAVYEEYYIHANEDLLTQVWINLIDNAVKFAPEAGEIGISIVEDPKTVTVSVKNNGPEINSSDQAHIFNKFWQGDTSHASEGTGIGLSIARRIVELHKGSIQVTSSEKETVFIVRLPKE